jgi:hypothetical protein
MISSALKTQTRRSSDGAHVSWGLLVVFFDSNNFAALVMPTIRAYGMRQAHLSTIGADSQVAGFKSVMGATAVTASLGNFAFWMWRHFVLLYNSSGIGLSLG